MNTETIVSPVEETQNQSTELTQPEVVTPEPDAEQSTEQQAPTEEDRIAKLQRTLERRAGRLTAAKYQAEARATQAEERAAALAAELSQYKQPQDTTPQQAPVDPIALANAIATVREVTAKANAVAKDGDRFPDFKQALTALAEEAGPLFTPQGFYTPLGEAILTADEPAKLLHWIGTRPEVASDLADLSPIQLGRRLDRIEAEMKAASSPKTSNAPKPLTPVKGAGGDSNEPSQMTDKEFAAWRKRQIAQRR